MTNILIIIVCGDPWVIGLFPSAGGCCCGLCHAQHNLPGWRGCRFLIFSSLYYSFLFFVRRLEKTFFWEPILREERVWERLLWVFRICLPVGASNSQQSDCIGPASYCPVFASVHFFSPAGLALGFFIFSRASVLCRRGFGRRFPWNLAWFPRLGRIGSFIPGQFDHWVIGCTASIGFIRFAGYTGYTVIGMIIAW